MVGDDRQKDLILFAGQPGIKLKDCLEKLADPKRNDISFLKVEEEMANISGNDFKKDILSYPPLIQEELWSRAFDKIEDEMLESKEKQYFYLTFHATYYHQEKTEFTSPVGFQKLAKVSQRVKMILVLIDDCYDIYKRLIDEDQMYHYVHELGPFEALLESILNLLNILSWREIEIAFSRKIASFLNVPLYVLAVKHPSFMISRLIRETSEKLKIMYLSHPISDVRKTSYPRLPHFYTELNEFIRKISRLDNVVLFIPDTIDEKRIKKDKSSEEYRPELLNGWPLPFSITECLFIPHLPHLQKINPLNPRDFDYASSSKELQSAISHLLRVLDYKITTQINARDRTLVEQSRNGIVLYRPYWNGIISSGVEEELKYNRIIREEYKQARKAFLLTTEEDVGKLCIRRLFTEIEYAIVDLDENVKGELEKLSFSWTIAPEKISQFYNKKFDKKEIRASLEEFLPRGYRFSNDYVSSRESALQKGMMKKKYSLQDEGWKIIWRRILVDTPFEKLLNSEDRYITCPEKSLHDTWDEFIKLELKGKR